MTLRSLLFLCLTATALANTTPLQPGHVAVVYNSTIPESRDLAEFYALNRNIPPGNLVGLILPKEETITRSAFEKRVRDPLRAEFDKREWWTLARDQNNTILPTSCKIRCLALIKGVPLRIERIAVPAAEAESKAQFKENNEAAVDSELAMLGVRGLPIGGPLQNRYFTKEMSFIQAPLPYQLLVGRIDAKNYDTCKRMVLDALDAEEQGLWGRAYVDFAIKGGAFAMGDQWLELIAKRSLAAGFPTITDRNKDTFVTNYPMQEAAIYFGWYTFHRNGPFLDPSMKFQRGAVAVHLHSLSAGQLGDPSKNWSSALLDRGAAATLGNTWEPFLQMSHNFEIFHDRLLKGYSLAESAAMAINVLSWQNLVLGDPLYRPFKNRGQKPADLKFDRDYKILRMVYENWSDPAERTTKLEGAAERMKSGIIYETLGTNFLEAKEYVNALEHFTKARAAYPDGKDKLRQVLNIVALERRQGNKSKALSMLQAARKEFRQLPQSQAIDALIVILDPPAPPAAKPKK